jgi:CysZ protein
MPKQNSLEAGFYYFIEGAKLLSKPGMRRFVAIPIFANVVIFIFLTTLLFQYFSSVSQWFESVLSFWSWLAFLTNIIASILSGLIIFLVLLVYGFSFNIITNIIAAPFYGLLADKIQQKLTQEQITQDSIQQLIARTLKRELIKLWYFISRGLIVTIGLIILGFIPLVNLIVPVLGLIWGAWVMTLQYTDYPADNNKVSFSDLRKRVKKPIYSTLGHGGSIMLGSMIPLVNIFVMPIAVAAGTLFWVNELKDLEKR